jgi:cobyrinic acid a,c-diamide synthase
MLDRVQIPRLLIAGAEGGSGKTSVTMGLVAALRARGRSLQCFKVGSDFVDPSYLARASGRPCRNLDSWILGADLVRRSLLQGSLETDGALIEGGGGLFDSRGGPDPWGGIAAGRDFPGSTADVAHIVGAPVIIVLDVATMAETAAAIALGLRRLDPHLDIAGVILDRVASPERRRVVEDAIWERAQLPVLGALRSMPDAAIPELRGGLLPLGENPHVDQAIACLAAAVERDCDLDMVERLMRRADPMTVAPLPARSPVAPVRLGVAFDDAFSCYYAENLELLQDAGAEIVPFSPLEDRALPADIHALYLGGGLGEAHLPRVAANHGFLEQLRRCHAQGVPIYAEGGGLVACARSVRLGDGSVQRLAGLLPLDLGIDSAPSQHGYRQLRVETDCLLAPRGTRLRGHEERFVQLLSGTSCASAAYAMHDCDGEPLGCEGWVAGNLLGSFVHLHFAQAPAVVDRFMERARRRHEERSGLPLSVPR